MSGNYRKKGLFDTLIFRFHWYNLYLLLLSGNCRKKGLFDMLIFRFHWYNIYLILLSENCRKKGLFDTLIFRFHWYNIYPILLSENCRKEGLFDTLIRKGLLVTLIFRFWRCNLYLIFFCCWKIVGRERFICYVNNLIRKSENQRDPKIGKQFFFARTPVSRSFPVRFPMLIFQQNSNGKLSDR